MWFTYVAAGLSLLALAEGYSSGAPESSCQDMIPKHPVPPQKSLAPYTITTSSKVVKAGTPVEVVISGKGPSNTIRGLLLQAREGDKYPPIGKFNLLPSDPIAKTISCGGNAKVVEYGEEMLPLTGTTTTSLHPVQNTVTHKKHDEKDDQRTVAFTWTPPPGFKGEAKFKATIAQNGATFWVGVESAPFKVTAQ